MFKYCLHPDTLLRNVFQQHIVEWLYMAILFPLCEYYL